MSETFIEQTTALDDFIVGYGASLSQLDLAGMIEESC